MGSQLYTSRPLLCLADLDHPFSDWISVSPSGWKEPELDDLETVYLMFRESRPALQPLLPLVHKALQLSGLLSFLTPGSEMPLTSEWLPLLEGGITTY